MTRFDFILQVIGILEIAVLALGLPIYVLIALRNEGKGDRRECN